MNKFNLALLLIAALLSLTAALFFYSFFMFKEAHFIKADVEVSDAVLGFDLNKDAMHFGKVPRNAGSATRSIYLSNSDDFVLRFSIEATGELTKWTLITSDGKTYRQSAVVLVQPNSKKEVVLAVEPDSTADVGKTYNGTVKVLVTRCSLCNSPLDFLGI